MFISEWTKKELSVSINGMISSQVAENYLPATAVNKILNDGMLEEVPLKSRIILIPTVTVITQHTSSILE